MSADVSSGSARRRAILRTILVLCALPVVLIGPALWPGKRLLPLLPAAFAPWSIEDPDAARAASVGANELARERLFPMLTDELAEVRAWRRGVLPTWDPTVGLGMPLAATTSTGAWYPFNALKIVLGPDVASAWLAAWALFLAGLGMHAFLRVRGVSPWASAFGAWAMQGGGFALLNLHHASMVDAALWLPFAWLAVDGVLARRKHAGAILAFSLALSGLAGYAPIAVLVACATLAYAAWRAIESRQLARVPALVAWIVLGATMSAVQWLPRIEASGEALHERWTTEELDARTPPPVSLVTLVAPHFFGAPEDAIEPARNVAALAYTTRAQGVAAMSASSREWNFFAGVAVLLLAVAGTVARPRDALLPGVFLLVALGFAQGWPIASWLRALPGLDLRAPSISTAIAWTLWPWLAALGLDALLERRRRAALAVTLGIATFASLGTFVYFTRTPAEIARTLQQDVLVTHGLTIDAASATAAAQRIASESGRLALVALGCLAAVGVATRVRGDRMLARTLPWLALVAIEGALVARAHLVPRDLHGRALFPASSTIDAVRDAASGGRVLRCESSTDGSGNVQRLVPPNLLTACGISDLTPSNELVPRSLLELVAAVDAKSFDGARVTRIADPKVLGARVLDLLRVSCVLARAPLAHARLTATAAIPGFNVYARSGSFAPARVVPPDLVVASTPEGALGLLAQDGIDVRRAAVAFAGDLPAESARPRSDGAAFVPGTVETSRPAPDRLDARVRQSSGGWLVFHEQYFPGWKATVNGSDVPVVRVDHVCRAVPIPPGDCVVRTKYEPWSLRIGAAASLVAIAIALAFSFAPWRRGARSGSLH